ncbi:hypothetical protein F5884DRAFT_484496 [Xylogone sp. PMI_703]|nr:hypothetical protein F5884DRAFT_484496 [Xylogone sp. PMI_703]
MTDDEFDIDIYGDTNTEQEAPVKKDEEGDVDIEGLDTSATEEGKAAETTAEDVDEDDYVDIKLGTTDQETTNEQHGSQTHNQHEIKTNDEPGLIPLSIPKQAPQQQGVKRKEGSDDRPVDPGATTALLISELHWWNTDDDIRGWINQARVEDELIDISFSEHKVNGKSKGQAYIEFSSQQAATAAKHKIDTFGEGQKYVKKHVVTYSNPNVNPFRTVPKDLPQRPVKDVPTARTNSGGYSNDRGNQNGPGGNFGGNFRGRTPGYNQTRGNMNSGNFNRNFQNPMSNMGGGFNSPMGGFQGAPMGGQFGGFNRGGMMGNMRGGMRGGRGGMGNGMMPGLPMGGMPMSGMPGAMGGMGGMPMNMGAMGGAMQGAGGFQAQMPHFNPAFFQQNQGGGDWQNPHGAKRPRPE